MPVLRYSLITILFLVSFLSSGPRFAVPAAEAAQPWYCTCDGKSKRHLASTRFCEHQMGVPKGQTCTWLQWRMVYAPACRERGCYLP